MVNEIRVNQGPAGRGGLTEPSAAGGSARSAFRPAGSSPGFTLMEMLVVVAVVAVLLMMAVPALSMLAPQFLVRSSAESLASLMQRARLTANNTQKPIRLVLDCRDDKQRDNRLSTCTMLLYSANFNSDGNLDINNPDASRQAWTEISETRREINRRVVVSVAEASGGRPRSQPVYGEIGSSSTGYVYWAVFLPTGRVMNSSGQVLASHSPMRLVFQARDGGVRSRELSLNLFSSRVSLRAL